jgi:hypothetical protein
MQKSFTLVSIALSLSMILCCCRHEQNPISRETHNAFPDAGDPQIADTIVFDNISLGADHYHWDFGDGTTSTSTAKNISHVYSSPGWGTFKLNA